MEVAVIDWKDSKFVNDDLFEDINAPQWVDFSAPDESVDDEAWFCRPDCNHPKTIDDFLKETHTSKLQRSASVSEIIPFGGRNRRDVALKKRGLTQPSGSLNKESKCDRLVEDVDNQNPNLSTPLNHKPKFMKEAIKSSAEKKQVTDFFNELKRKATRKERENVEKENAKKSPVVPKQQEVKECSGNNSRVLDERKPLLEERKPLLEVSKEKYEAMEKSNVKEKQRRKKNNEVEKNTPICLDLKNIRRKEENLSQIRTLPPSPQCFSATPKAFGSRPLERGILQDLDQSNKDVKKEESGDKGTHGRNVSIAAEREAMTLDVFWFFKPCTLSS